MASQHPTPDRARDGDGPQLRQDAELDPGIPRWVKVFAVAGLILVLLLVVMMLTGHGPGRHMGAGRLGQPASIGLLVEMRGIS